MGKFSQLKVQFRRRNYLRTESLRDLQWTEFHVIPNDGATVGNL